MSNFSCEGFTDEDMKEWNKKKEIIQPKDEVTKKDSKRSSLPSPTVLAAPAILKFPKADRFDG